MQLIMLLNCIRSKLASSSLHADNDDDDDEKEKLIDTDKKSQQVLTLPFDEECCQRCKKRSGRTRRGVYIPPCFEPITLLEPKKGALQNFDWIV